jgi:hypothetical protein
MKTSDEHESLSHASHYDKPWHEIFFAGYDPFPQRPGGRPRSFGAAFRAANQFLHDYAGVTILAFTLSVFVLAFGAYREVVGTANESTVENGPVSVPIDAAQRKGSREVVLRSELPISRNSFVLARPTESNPDVATSAELDFRGDRAVLVVTVDIGRQAQIPNVVEVNWMVVP